MPKVRVTRDAPVSSRQAFEMLTDVEAFPAYVTGVQSMRRENVKRIGPLETFDARAFIRLRRLSGTFVAAVVIDHAAQTIRITPKLGPVKVMSARCRAVDIPQGAQVSCELDLELALPGLKALLEQRLTTIAAAYAELFVQRCVSLPPALAA
jgi:ribosome-associated toxin RatA of RatAB toxin-antitoxin module